MNRSERVIETNKRLEQLKNDKKNNKPNFWDNIKFRHCLYRMNQATKQGESYVTCYSLHDYHKMLLHDLEYYVYNIPIQSNDSLGYKTEIIWGYDKF